MTLVVTSNYSSMVEIVEHRQWCPKLVLYAYIHFCFENFGETEPYIVEFALFMYSYSWDLKSINQT